MTETLNHWRPPIVGARPLWYPQTVEARDGQARPIGREAELASLELFLASDGEPSVQLVTGVPGIGKTTLWETALAGGAGTTLQTRASEAEAQLSFAGLADLLSSVDATLLATLPEPQRYALAVALRRESPDAGPPEELAVSLGFLGTLTLLAEHAPVVVAVDDVQWLDRATVDVLGFALRRLRDAPLPVRFFLAQRAGADARLLESVAADRRTSLAIEPLSAGALRSILFERLGLTLTRQGLHRLFETVQGNPLFALELGRAMLDRDGDAIEGEVALPENVEQLLGTRVSRLPAPQRQLLVAVAVCPTLEPAQLRAVAREETVEEAVDAGLVTIVGNRVRAAHPLLAAAALEQVPARSRRAVNAALAETVTDEQLRAKLLAGAATGPDSAVADAIATAAMGAEGLGAIDDAVVLTGHALDLTPIDSPARPARILLHGRLLALSGRPESTVELFTSELEALPEGPLRAEALIGLASETTDPVAVRDHLARALRECPDDPGVRAAATAILALREAVIELRDVAGAEGRLAAELENAELAGPELEIEILIDLLWINALRGYSVDDAFSRFPTLSARRLTAVPIPVMIGAQRLYWRGEIAEARTVLAGLLARNELGARFYALNRMYLCDLELRCGRLAVAERLLAEWAESADDDSFVWPMYERCRAQLAASRGDVDETERWVEATIAKAAVTDEGWNRLEAIRARGLVALAAGDAATAVASLSAVWEHTRREAIDEPGVFPVAPDLVDALCETGQTAEAHAVVDELALLAEHLDHPWARLGARRASAVIGLAEHGDHEGATSVLAEVAAAYAALGLELDRARCLLTLGRAERRRKRWAAARGALEMAVAAFEELGASGWAALTRSELSRVGARRPAPEGSLTPSEARTAALAAEGLANKEIAARLHVTVHTVEVHLSRAYAKLGVRSRTQLAAKLLARER